MLVCRGCGNFSWRAEKSFNRKPQACVFALTALSDLFMPNAHACGLQLNNFSLPKPFVTPPAVHPRPGLYFLKRRAYIVWPSEQGHLAQTEHWKEHRMTMQLISPKSHCGGVSAGTQAVRAGNLIFVGGQMSLDERGQAVGSDITSQATNAFEALKRVLAEAGATMGDVVKHNVYLNCEGDAASVRKLMNELDAVRVKYFSAPGPTTTETRVGLDRKGALILIDAWAVVGATNNCWHQKVIGVGIGRCRFHRAGKSAT